MRVAWEIVVGDGQSEELILEGYDAEMLSIRILMRQMQCGLEQLIPSHAFLDNINGVASENANCIIVTTSLIRE